MSTLPADGHIPTALAASAPERELVLVTGGSGLIALHCIHQLLLSGYDVRATVRSAAKESKVTSAIRAALSDENLTPTEQLASSSSSSIEDFLSRISFAHVDLVKEDGWIEAVRGASYVLHVASPFPPVAPKNESELIKPAREGTLRVLRAAAAARTSSDGAGGTKLRRVVLTSSVAAIAYGVPVDGERMFTEADWTDETNVKDYTKSKVLAERAAWDFMEKEGNAAGLELAVINPVGQ